MHDAIERLHERILRCTACHDAGLLEIAAPIRHRWMDSQRTMIVGQAPGLQTHQRRYHFAGPGGVLLGRWLAAAGFPEDCWRERCYITSLTRCFPGKAAHGSGDRRPSSAEIELCGGFLEAELTLIRPRLIVPVGMMATERFLGRVRLEDVIGQVFERDGRAVLPLPHPSGVSRWLNQPDHKLLVQRAIERLASLRVELDL